MASVMSQDRQQQQQQWPQSGSVQAESPTGRNQSSKRVALYNDGILLLSFAYSGMDVLSQWSEFDRCHKHIGLWLLGSYLMMAIFRLCNYLGHLFSASGEQILHVRQSALMPRVIVGFTWCLLLPAFTLWTVMGTSWLAQALWYSPGCLPAGAHPTFVIFCQVLCYVWIAIHAIYLRSSLKFELRVRRAEANLRSVETEGTLQRWGRVTFLGETPNTEAGALGVGRDGSRGLEASVIQSLPRVQVKEGLPPCGEQCAICIEDFKDGDWGRRLPNCKHWFHQECIDLWLLRSPCCPLCKTDVADERDKV